MLYVGENDFRIGDMKPFANPVHRLQGDKCHWEKRCNLTLKMDCEGLLDLKWLYTQFGSDAR